MPQTLSLQRAFWGFFSYLNHHFLYIHYYRHIYISIQYVYIRIFIYIQQVVKKNSSPKLQESILFQPIFRIKTYSFSVAKQRELFSLQQSPINKITFSQWLLPRLPFTSLVVLHCQTQKKNGCYRCSLKRSDSASQRTWQFMK